MEQGERSMWELMRRPSVLLPLAMSVAALVMVLGDVALFGVVREKDEGAVAHLFQILMAGQLPMMAVFAVRWLPRCPRRAMGVLGMMVGAAAMACAPVFLLRL